MLFEKQLLGPSDFKPKGGRRKRGGADPDQAPVVQMVIEETSSVSDGDQDTINQMSSEKKRGYRDIVMTVLSRIATDAHTALTSQVAKDAAILGITVVAAGAAIQQVDAAYKGALCTPLTNQIASSLTLVGFPTKEEECRHANQAYNQVFGLLKPIVTTVVSAAAGKLVNTVRISVGEGFVGKAMVALANHFGLPLGDSAAPPAPTGKSARGSKSAAPGATGGRTKRRGSKKGRKGGKSRKHRR